MRKCRDSGLFTRRSPCPTQDNFAAHKSAAPSRDPLSERTSGSGAVCEKSGLFSLTPLWRDVLPEIVTIEAKIKNWQEAVEQAARNRVFAHRSFVALPESLARRVRSEGILQRLGLGLLSVGDDLGTRISRRARRHRPRVWSYYYKLATLLATDVRSHDRALYGSD
jgi:hypothetical protein